MIFRSRFITAVAAALAIPTFDLKAEPFLKDVYREHFLIGTAVDEDQMAGAAPAQTALIQATLAPSRPGTC